MIQVDAIVVARQIVVVNYVVVAGVVKVDTIMVVRDTIVDYNVARASDAYATTVVRGSVVADGVARA